MQFQHYLWLSTNINPINIFDQWLSSSTRERARSPNPNVCKTYVSLVKTHLIYSLFAIRTSIKRVKQDEIEIDCNRNTFRPRIYSFRGVDLIVHVVNLKSEVLDL